MSSLWRLACDIAVNRNVEGRHATHCGMTARELLYVFQKLDKTGDLGIAWDSQAILGIPLANLKLMEALRHNPEMRIYLNRLYAERETIDWAKVDKAMLEFKRHNESLAVDEADELQQIGSERLEYRTKKGHWIPARQGITVRRWEAKHLSEVWGCSVSRARGVFQCYRYRKGLETIKGNQQELF